MKGIYEKLKSYFQGQNTLVQPIQDVQKPVGVDREVQAAGRVALQYGLLTVNQLQRLCSLRNLSTSRLKNELVERLAFSDEMLGSRFWKEWGQESTLVLPPPMPVEVKSAFPAPTAPPAPPQMENPAPMPPTPTQRWPPAPPVVPGNAPTNPQIGLAKMLSNHWKVAIPEECWRDRIAMSNFIQSMESLYGPVGRRSSG